MGVGARKIRAGWLICLAVIGALALPTSAAAFVYWAHGGRRDRPRQPRRSGVNKSFITGVFGCGVAVDGAHIYWGDQWDDRIGRANLDGSGVDQRLHHRDRAGTCGVAVDGAHVYWANQSCPAP